MTSRSILRYAGVLACTAPLTALAQTAAEPATTQLDTITVTASRVPTDARTQAVPVSVISAEDIQTSGARTLQDVLSTQSSVHVINNTGSSDNGVVDLRGFGLTGLSNTLILVDGIKQNDNDLSAPTLGTIPLDQIERIEIVRGSGAVQYGGGATGGVINIITRRGFERPVDASAKFSIGNYGLRQTDLHVQANNGKVGVQAWGQTLQTDNYRDNNRERRAGGGGALTFQHDTGSIRLYARTTTQKLGLPGPRAVDPATGLNQYEDDPRGATYPDDYIKSTTDAFGLQVRQQIWRGTLFADLSQRNKRLYGFTNDGFGDTIRQQELEETTGSVRYQLPFQGGHSLVVGADGLYNRTNATQEAYYSFAPDQTSARQRQHSVFAEGTVQATSTTTVTLGGRRQYASDDLRVESGFKTPSDESRHLSAWQLALRQEVGAGFSAYGKIGRSFRLANADELFMLQDPLKPQTSTDKELGVLWSQGASSARLAWFQSDLKNEIHYNPLTFANVNLDPTRRQGVELEGRYAVTPSITLDGNVTWTEAKFRSGTYAGVDLAGNRVPLVPEWLANAGVTWRATDALFLGASAQYVGSSRMDNDQANQFKTKIGDYVLFNARAGYRFTRNVEGTLAVNNLFDRDYATYGIRGTDASFMPLGPTGRYNLYPGMGRNVMASLTVRY
ncbi:TonB-dependent outer membrane receptor [Bordetella ansorpii]|uniref:TonB-dependent outer membrane receptor n=1 Tax=Bordetella ansorpii TaxID=288768 RepID=A0A157QTG7_9BORD|nr:TonB-dependent receptor [Bordetella ansorpii]SAI48894.1 TonB-dependent outer membrane receptor [Bordetella ansorpii]